VVSSGPHDIHLFLTFYDEVTDERLLAAYRQMLSLEEQKQEQRFHFERDRHRYVVSRALVRTSLSRFAAVAPEHWSFTVGRYGRPEIANQPADSGRLSFNLSHTHGLIALAVGHEREIGVDTENTLRRVDSLEDVAKRFFAPSEYNALMAQPTDERADRFFHYWTLKESYLKARGTGLSTSLDLFSFDLATDSTIEFSRSPQLHDGRSDWFFWLFQPSAEHVVAICAERLDNHAVQLVSSKVVPLDREENYAPALLRSSGCLAV
jgi:4'-phosphopantetheinyl transferase